jgi:hypothetical protein
MSTQLKQEKKKSGLTLRGCRHIQSCVKFHAQFHFFEFVKFQKLESLFDPHPFPLDLIEISYKKASYDTFYNQ